MKIDKMCIFYLDIADSFDTIQWINIFDVIWHRTDNI